jgi:vWA-MoxR associated protein C-terminal domain/vWA-MoxR associated protein middle region (VMAP-M) 1/Effector-associated domain 1
MTTISDQIDDALSDAFREPEQLKQMLWNKLSKRLSDIVSDNDNYQVVRNKVISDFSRSGELANLINAALAEIPNNSKLQKVNRIYPIFQILVPLVEKGYFPEIQQVYRDCCPEDWDDLNRETLEDILDDLEDMGQGDKSHSPTVYFIARLAANPKIPQTIVKDLKKWGNESTNNFSNLLTQIKNEKGSDNKPQENVPTYIIVLLKPSKQYQNKRYSVQAWFIPDGRGNKLNFKTGEGYQILELRNQPKEIFSLKEISCLLEDFRKQSSQYIPDSSQHPIIMFFLPRKLLNVPVDTWRIRNIPIGTQHKVLIRTYERDSEYEFQSIWKDKWKLSQEQLEELCSCHVISGGCDWKTLFVKLNQSNAVALKLSKPPSQDIFNVIHETAIPVAIWLRCKQENINFQAELDTLLNCPLFELPEQVRKKRLEAFPIEDENAHIGHNLSLLWEDPHILPVKIDYSQP